MVDLFSMCGRVVRVKPPKKVDAINELEMDFNDVRDWLVRGFDYNTNTLLDEAILHIGILNVIPNHVQLLVE